ncbi:terminase small subunit [Bosea sp. RCC_152_1]|uniref:terminase small subunit n=1 Tax=Bosea sp. RCC_152_1 TaxID=3239228 RepID=UPI003526466A
MPVLRNNRHEAFAQAIAKGLAARTAYKAAGYGASDKAAEACASRLLTDAKVAARVLELQSKAARKVEVTVESIARELEEARVLAIAEKQSSAAVAASMGKAKLFGLIVEKHKHSGSIGTYDLTKLSDDELGSLEAILGPLADAGGDQGGEE